MIPACPTCGRPIGNRATCPYCWWVAFGLSPPRCACGLELPAGRRSSCLVCLDRILVTATRIITAELRRAGGRP